MARLAIRVRWTGIVQGVWFRDFVHKAAAKHRVSGWVMNRPDGSVEGQLEGDSKAIGAVLGETFIGPPAAEVARVEVDVCESAGMKEFEIRY